jgi:hypothetical protein
MAFASDGDGEGTKGGFFFAGAIAAAGFVLTRVPFGFMGALDLICLPHVLEAFLRGSLI